MRAAREDRALQYEDYGSGPAIVILHDYPSNRELRRTHFEILAAAGCRVIITNPAGLGQAPAARGGAEVEGQTRKVMALLNYLGIGRAVLIGIGRGGQVLLDLMERFPARVAAASFVLGPAMAADLRRRAGRPEVQAALREGRFDDLKNAFSVAMTAIEGRPAPGQLHRLRAWAAGVARLSRDGARPRQGDCAGLLAALQLPPLLLETAGEDPPPRRVPNRFSPFRALNSHLAALLGMLLPAEELFEEGGEELDDGAV